MQHWWRPELTGRAALLLPLSWLFGALTGLRRALYRARLLRVTHVPVPVIVVGNLTAGGSGKTPLVIALVHALRAAGYTAGVISRGYGGAHDRDSSDASGGAPLEITAGIDPAQSGDEPLLIRRRTGAPVFVSRDRPRAAQAVLTAYAGVNVILSDDGLQHYALARDIEIAVFDERGVGNGRLLPAGPLREPFAVRIPLRSIALYNAPQRSTPWPGSLGQRRLTGLVDLQAWWDRANPAPVAPQSLQGQPLIAAAGIANPQRFFDMLRECGLNFEEIALPDHHAFSELPWPRTAEHVVITEKDAVKITPGRAGPTHIWVAALDFHVDAAFEAELMALLPARPLRETAHGSPSA